MLNLSSSIPEEIKRLEADRRKMKAKMKLKSDKSDIGDTQVAMQLADFRHQFHEQITRPGKEWNIKSIGLILDHVCDNADVAKAVLEHVQQKSETTPLWKMSPDVDVHQLTLYLEAVKLLHQFVTFGYYSDKDKILETQEVLVGLVNACANFQFESSQATVTVIGIMCESIICIDRLLEYALSKRLEKLISGFSQAYQALETSKNETPKNQKKKSRKNNKVASANTDAATLEQLLKAITAEDPKVAKAPSNSSVKAYVENLAKEEGFGIDCEQKGGSDHKLNQDLEKLLQGLLTRNIDQSLDDEVLKSFGALRSLVLRLLWYATTPPPHHDHTTHMRAAHILPRDVHTVTNSEALLLTHDEHALVYENC